MPVKAHARLCFGPCPPQLSWQGQGHLMTRRVATVWYRAPEIWLADTTSPKVRDISATVVWSLGGVASATEHALHNSRRASEPAPVERRCHVAGPIPSNGTRRPRFVARPAMTGGFGIPANNQRDSTPPRSLGTRGRKKLKHKNQNIKNRNVETVIQKIKQSKVVHSTPPHRTHPAGSAQHAVVTRLVAGMPVPRRRARHADQKRTRSATAHSR